jgi:hypothetical protein
LWDPFGALGAARIWVWAALALLTFVTNAPTWAAAIRPGPTEGVDFFQEWASAKNLMVGSPIYADLEESARVYLRYTLAPGEQMRIRRNAHPPTSVLAAIPFALLDYPNGMLAWNITSLAALVVSLWLIGRELGLRPKPWTILPAITLAFLSNPLRQQISHGQLNLILLLILTMVWVADRSNRPGWAGALLGLATAIKLFPGIFFLYFMLRRRWTVVTAGAAALAAATALTVAILGFETYRSYLRDVLPQVSVFRNWWLNASLAGFWIKWFDAGAVSSLVDPALPDFLPPVARQPGLARLGLIVSTLVVLGAWARVVWRARTRQEEDLAFGLTLTTMLLVSPLTWDHYFLLILLPLAQLWIALSQARRERLVLLLLFICLWAGPYDVWTAFIPGPGSPPAPVRSLLVISFQFFALLGVFALGIRAAHRGPASPVPRAA